MSGDRGRVERVDPLIDEGTSAAGPTIPACAVPVLAVLAATTAVECAGGLEPGPSS